MSSCCIATRLVDYCVIVMLTIKVNYASRVEFAVACMCWSRFVDPPSPKQTMKFIALNGCTPAANVDRTGWCLELCYCIPGNGDNRFTMPSLACIVDV